MIPSARRGLLWLGVLSAALGCGGDGRPAEDTTCILRAGDSLLDELAFARVSTYPAHNLPAEIAALASDPIRVQVPVSPLAWERVEAMPAWLEQLMREHTTQELWWAQPPMPLLPDEKMPEIVVAGQRQPLWDPAVGREPPDGLAIWYPPETMMLALGNDRPMNVGLEGTVQPELEFGLFERGTLLRDEAPAPELLSLRHELGEMKRSALLLPATSVMEFDVEELRADRLHVSVGVADQGWMLRNDIIHRRRGASDGAEFMVEVVPAAAPTADGPPAQAPVAEQVWRHVLPAEQVGAGWHDAVVDVSAWRGQAVTLRFITGPGSAGNTEADYALWGDLRLRGGPERPPTRPHVVFIDIDTLRADRLTAYGATREITPRLDAWAAERAMVYLDAVATAPWTLPSTVSMFTGMAVHQHGVDKAADALSGQATTITTLLAEAGYETHGIASGGYLRTVYGCDVGFESYETRDPKDMDWTAALDLVRQRDSERPFFLFLHTYAVHAPYEHNTRFVDPAYDGPLASLAVDRDTVFDPYHEGEMALEGADRQYVIDLYDGLVANMDVVVADFLEELRALVGDDELLVVFTSDHGEAFLEHDLLGHGLSLYGELLRVPLVIEYPDGGAGLSDSPASGLDILPTVLDVVGLPLPEGLPGRSLRTTDPRAVRVAQAGVEQRSTMSEGYKLIEPFKEGGEGEVELYHLDVDLGELKNLAGEDPQRVEDLRRRLEWFLGTHPPPASASAVESAAGSAVLDELRALGYLGDG